MSDYLQKFDSASEAEKYPLVRKWMKTEPLPFFAEVRAHRPVLVTPECTLVTLFSDVTDILKMPKVFTVDLYKPKMGVTDDDPGYLMAHDDDALHYREKSLMQGLLNRDDLPKVRKLVEETAARILEDADGRIEIVNQYCRMVPAHLVQDYFGLDGIDREDLIEWSFWNQYDAFHNQPFDLNSDELDARIRKRHDEVSEELVAYIAVLMVRKSVRAWFAKLFAIVRAPFRVLMHLVNAIVRREPEKPLDTIVKRMVRSKFDKEIDFPIVRIGINAGGLLIGAIETTSQAVSQVIEFFLEDPDLLRRAKATASAANPEAFDAMVWEALRFVPIAPYVFRQAAEDYTIAMGTERETRIAAGTNVLLITQSAMFDSYAFDDPDEFNPNRNWYHHFNFGFGSHECLGKYVGMVMIPEMVRQVILRTDIEAQGPIDYKDGPFPEELELSWSA